MKVTLVRHGQTEDNYKDLIQGRKNNLLNDTGRRQCQRLRDEFRAKHFDICYTSPLIRCVETAMILIGDRVEMIPDERLIERDFGQLDGKPNQLYDFIKYWDYDKNCSDLGIESIQDMFKRCRLFLDYILDKHDGEDILLVTHGATFRVLHHLLLKHELKGNLLDIAIDNCFYEEIEIKK